MAYKSKGKLRTMLSYFGNKRKVVNPIWERFGDPELYVEPFCGSAATLFGRPTILRAPGLPVPVVHRQEILNDFNPFIVNFLRSMQAEPEKVAALYERRASMPTTPRWEAGRQVKRFLRSGEETLRANLQDLTFYNPAIAAQFLYINENSLYTSYGMVGDGRPTLERGRVRPSVLILDALGWGTSVNTRLALSNRLRDVEIRCGDWYDVVADLDQPATVFLDPPYRKDSGLKNDLYEHHRPGLAVEVAAWAIANADKHKIALCGYEGDYEMPSTWEVFPWKSDGGRGRAHWERIWFSP